MCMEWKTTKKEQKKIDAMKVSIKEKLSYSTITVNKINIDWIIYKKGDAVKLTKTQKENYQGYFK